MLIAGFAAPASGGQPSWLAAAAEPAAAPEGSTELFLEATVNGVPSGRVERFILRGGSLWTSARTLTDLGLRLPDAGAPDAQLRLADLAGLQVEYDAPRQRIALMAPVAMLARPAQRLVPETNTTIQADPALPSLLLAYDAYVQRHEGLVRASSLSAFTELRLSGVGPGLWDSTAVSRASSSGGSHEAETVRLDTWWQYDLPASMVSFTAGDSLTGALSWTRATRIGGLKLARNFGLQPYLSTAPPALVRGEAVLPSTVDLYINGVRQLSRPVQPGNFIIEGTSMLNGAGQARMVITDINGRQRVVDFPFYGAPQLLRQGLLDGSVELGAVREHYGERSAEYSDRIMASGSGRYGWSESLTLEAHAEGDGRVAMAGAGAVWSLPMRLGVVAAAAAASRTSLPGAQPWGHQAGLGYQWNGGPLNLALGTLRRDAAFRDVASGHGSALARATDQAFLGAASPWGSVGVGYVRQVFTGQLPSRLATFSWTRGLPHDANLSINVVRDLQARTNGMTLLLYVPLDSRVSVAASARRDHGRSTVTLGAARSAPPELEGWGWRVETTAGDARSALAELRRTGALARWTAGVSRQQGQGPDATLLYGAASGALVWAGGHGFATPTVDDAFAVVTTEGVAGVPVQLENRLVGQTDEDGLLLVRGLRPWERNRLSIDPLQLSPDLRLPTVRLEAVPAGRAGVAARFALRPVAALQFELHDPAGQPFPPGTPARLETPGAPPVPIILGYDGLVYLENPPAGATLRVETGSGPCTVPLPPLEITRGLRDAGTIACRRTPH